jgi:hypothetical protein
VRFVFAGEFPQRPHDLKHPIFVDFGLRLVDGKFPKEVSAPCLLGTTSAFLGAASVWAYKAFLATLHVILFELGHFMFAKGTRYTVSCQVDSEDLENSHQAQASYKVRV